MSAIPRNFRKQDKFQQHNWARTMRITRKCLETFEKLLKFLKNLLTFSKKFAKNSQNLYTWTNESTPLSHVNVHQHFSDPLPVYVNYAWRLELQSESIRGHILRCGGLLSERGLLERRNVKSSEGKRMRPIFYVTSCVNGSLGVHKHFNSLAIMTVH